MIKKLLSIIVIFMLIAAISACRKQDDTTNKIAYIQYSENYNYSFCKYIQDLSQDKGYELSKFNCETSPSSAIANMTAAINLKVDFIIIDYPEENFCKQLADMAKSSDTKYLILNHNISDYICYTFDSEKTKIQIFDAVSSKTADKMSYADVCISLCTDSSAKEERQLTLAVNDALAGHFNVSSNFAANELVNSNPDNVSEYIVDMLKTIDKNKKFVFICQNSDIASGVRNAVKKLEISQNTVIASCAYDNSSQYDMDDTWCISLTADYSSIDELLLKDKPKSLIYNTGIIQK